MRETLLGRNLWLPTQRLPRAGDVRATLPGIILGQGFVDELAPAASELQDKAGHLLYGVLDRIADVHRARLGALHQAEDPLYQVVDVLDAPRLRAVAVDRERFP